MFTSIAHATITETLETRYFENAEPRDVTVGNQLLRKRALAVTALICAALGMLIVPLVPALLLGHYVLATTDSDAPASDRVTEVARGYASAALIVGYIGLAVTLFSLSLR